MIYKGKNVGIMKSMTAGTAMSYDAKAMLAMDNITDGNTIDEKIELLFKRYSNAQICGMLYNLLQIKVEYKVDRFTLSLRKDIVESFNDLVCPIDTDVLHSFTKSYINNKYVTDEVMSALIEANMLKEIHQYD